MLDSPLTSPGLAPGKVVRRVLDVLLRPIPMRQGVLMVTRADIFPPNHGAAVKIDRTAWGLSRLAGPVFLVTDDREHYHRYVDGRREAVRFPIWLSRIGPWRRAMRRRLRRVGVPVPDAFLYFPLQDWSLLLRAAYVAARHGVRVFQAEFPAYARVCLWVSSLLGGRTILVEHNVEFERLRDQVKDLSPDGYAFLRRTEITLCNEVDLVVAVSNRDRDTLISHAVHAERVHVIPHGVDIRSFDNVAVPSDLLQRHGVAPNRPVLVYHGTYLYPPNLGAIQILADEILPRLAAKGLHPVVLAIGPNPPDRALHPDVAFVGGVDAVAPYIKAADVAVVPLQQGGGTRMKVLDYFAAAVPVVSTAKGVEGLDLTDEDQLLIRDGYGEIADAVEHLLRDRERARSLGSAGRSFVERFDWLNIARSYIDLFARNADGGKGFPVNGSPRPDSEA